MSTDPLSRVNIRFPNNSFLNSTSFEASSPLPYSQTQDNNLPLKNNSLLQNNNKHLSSSIHPSANPFLTLYPPSNQTDSITPNDISSADQTDADFAFSINDFNKVSDRSDIQASLLEAHFSKPSFIANIKNIKNSNFVFDVQNQLTYLYTLKLAIILENRDANNKRATWHRQRHSQQSANYTNLSPSPNNNNRLSNNPYSAKSFFNGHSVLNDEKRSSFSVLNVRHNSTEFAALSSQKPILDSNYTQTPALPQNNLNTPKNIPTADNNFKNNKHGQPENVNAFKNVTNTMMNFVSISKNKIKKFNINSDNSIYKLSSKNKFLKKNPKQKDPSFNSSDLPSPKNTTYPNKSDLQIYSSHKLVLENFRSKLKKRIADKSLHILTKSIFSRICDTLNEDSYILRVSKDPDLQPFLMDIVQTSASSISQKNIANKDSLKNLTFHQLTPIIDVLNLAINDSFLNKSEASKFSQRMQTLLHSQAKIYFERLNHFSSTSENFESQIASQRVSKITFSEINQPNEYSNVSDFQFNYSTSWVQIAFNIIPTIHVSTLATIKEDSTEIELNNDIKRCLELTVADLSFTEKKTDFLLQDAYELWKQRETTSLNQLIEVQLHRQIIKNKDSPNLPITPFSFQNNSSGFNFIPDNVFGHYRNLIKHAINTDILSPFKAKKDTNYTISFEANKILKLAAITWRIGGAFQVTSYLDIIKDLWINEEIYPQYLYEAMGKVVKMVGIIPLDLWSISQKNYLDNVCKGVELKIISMLEDIIENPFQIDITQVEIIMKVYKAIDSISPIKNGTIIAEGNVNPYPDCNYYILQLRQLIFSSVEYLYHQMYENAGIRSKFDDINADSYLSVLKDISTTHRHLSIAFEKMIKGIYAVGIDIPFIVLEIHLKLFLDDLNKLFGSTNKELEKTDVENLLDIYHQAKSLIEICNEKGSKFENYNLLEQLLKSGTSRWLDVLEQESLEWMRNAILADKIDESSQKAYYSSSILDILTCFSQQTSVILDIKWLNAKSYGEFLNRFCKIMGHIFEQYAITAEQQFLDIQKKIMIPSEPTVNFNENSEKLDSQNINPSLDEAVHFSLETCVKLNNLHIAINQLHEIVKKLRVNETIKELGGDSRFLNLPVQNDKKPVYIVEIVNAEEIELLETSKKLFDQASVNVYAKLKMFFQEKARGKKTVTIGKTRPVPLNAMNPRWEEEFRIEPHPFLGSIVNSKKVNEMQYPIGVEICSQSTFNSLVKKNTVHGRGLFYISHSSTTSSGNSTEINVDLEPCGHLHLRISKESSVDDFEYYCLRMFNKLKRTLRDLQQRIVEQASAAIRTHILRTLIMARGLNKKAQENSDLFESPENKSENTILPSDIVTPKTREVVVRTFSFLTKGIKRSSSYKIYKDEWEDDLIPVVNYLERNLHILYNFLYDSVALGVILRIWKEILHTFEDFILPQLRGNKSVAEMRLNNIKLDHIYNLIEFFKWFLNGGDDKDGIPMNLLENSWYLGLIYIKDNYFNSTEDLELIYLESLKSSMIISMTRNTSELFDNQLLPMNDELSYEKFRNEPHPYDSSNKMKDLQNQQNANYSLESYLNNNSVQNSNGIKPSSPDQVTLSLQENDVSETKSKLSFLSFFGNKKSYEEANSINSKSQKADGNKKYMFFGTKRVSVDNVSANLTPIANNSQPQPTIKVSQTPKKLESQTHANNFNDTDVGVAHQDYSSGNKTTKPTAHELLDMRKPEIILRLLRLSENKRSLNFVKKQLEIREKQLDFNTKILK
ncbi:hypothetical protein BB561_003478 [Smittium simulii]|uniref:C2 domain-containing protein n=1 Tax=Smittium simulii TaxID=133385 RepID=A0A2T9YL61_9FUNG|nr:hypothetical protein BB561_003478 [Smittium simulii]